MNLDKILQDALEYEKIRDAATPGEWVFKDDGFQGSGSILSEFHSRPIADILAGWVYPKNIADTTQYIDARNGDFIATAKNYDSPKIIRELVERVKELEKALFSIAYDEHGAMESPINALRTKLAIARSVLKKELP